MANYRIGVQPCDRFTPQDDLFTGSGNVHDCFAPFHSPSVPRCAESHGGTVSFCTHCHCDHHSNGYETCAGYRRPAEESEGE